jgi:hypothetical protein
MLAGADNPTLETVPRAAMSIRRVVEVSARVVESTHWLDEIVSMRARTRGGDERPSLQVDLLIQ